MSYKLLSQKFPNYESATAFALLIIVAALLSGCGSRPIYPAAQAYDQQVHGLDKGNIALFTCTNLPPSQIRKKVELQIQSYVTRDPIEKVKAWYDKKLSDWTKLVPTDTAKTERCPNGVSYVFPEQCQSEGCTKQIYILDEASNETWIVLITLK